MTKRLLTLLLGGLFAGATLADTGCDAKAVEKKLNGAAKASFLKKCEREAQVPTEAAGAAKCEAEAKAKKLYGAARNSFVKKCSADPDK